MARSHRKRAIRESPLQSFELSRTSRGVPNGPQTFSYVRNALEAGTAGFVKFDEKTKKNAENTLAICAILRYNEPKLWHEEAFFWVN